MMDIHSPKGTKVVYLGGADNSSINWGSHDDPRGVLLEGHTYTVDRTEVHTWHTKVYLQEFPNKHFNSVWFDETRNLPKKKNLLLFEWAGKKYELTERQYRPCKALKELGELSTFELGQ